eukprot:jgi/Tetstr1/437520/TSEL_026198.t1
MSTSCIVFPLRATSLYSAADLPSAPAASGLPDSRRLNVSARPRVREMTPGTMRPATQLLGQLCQQRDEARQHSLPHRHTATPPPPHLHGATARLNPSFHPVKPQVDYPAAGSTALDRACAEGAASRHHGGRLGGLGGRQLCAAQRQRRLWATPRTSLRTRTRRRRRTSRRWRSPSPRPRQRSPAAAGEKPKFDEPLDDPVAEKLRQQRLVEEADFAAVQDLFLLPHADSSHYKTLMKTLNKVALVSMTAQETKDVETSLAGMRTDKLKQEREAVKQKKDVGKKKDLNYGRGGTTKGGDQHPGRRRGRIPG